MSGMRMIFSVGDAAFHEGLGRLSASRKVQVQVGAKEIPIGVTCQVLCAVPHASEAECPWDIRRIS